MPRPKRADEANQIYHALNRGNARSEIFLKLGDYEAFERILAEGLERYPCRILSYQLMPNHWHFILQPTEDGGMSSFLRWVTLTHTQRYHAHYGTSGQGHVYQGRFKSFPSRMMITTSWRRGMLNEMHCKQTWWNERKIGDGGRCIAGSATRSLLLNCCRRGPCLGFRIGLVESMNRSAPKSWRQFAGVSSGELPSAMRRGSSQSPVASTSHRHCVHADDPGSEVCPKAESMTNAVGTGIAARPPHRSVRAELPHTAPTLDDDDQSRA